MIFSKLMLIAVGAGVVNALPILTVPDAQEDRLVDLDSPASQVSIRFLNGEVDSKAVLVKYTDNGVLKQIHINANSDTASVAVDPTKEITILSDYSPYYLVCKVAPGTLKEDDDAVSTAVKWGNPCKVSRPSPSPSPAPSPSPSPSALCGGGKVVSRAGNSNAWSVLDGQEITNSCGPDYHIAPTEMCEGDSTSIIFQKNDQPACMGAKTCDFPLKDLVSIEADIAMYDCDLTWTAPLWTSPKSGWCTTPVGHTPSCPVGGFSGDQALSGEIDFVETCLVGGTTTLATSLGSEFPKNFHGDSIHFQNFFSPKGTQLHYSLKVTDLENGDAEMGVCDQGEATCTPATFKQKTTYTDWYSSHGCQHGTDCKFQLRSGREDGQHGLVTRVLPTNGSDRRVTSLSAFSEMSRR